MSFQGMRICLIELKASVFSHSPQLSFTRVKAEKFLTNKLRIIKNNTDYWYQGTSDQFRGLLEEYKPLANNAADMHTLEKVGITVNSNIHLNSFMYEPILDLTIEHLIALYNEVEGLNV